VGHAAVSAVVSPVQREVRPCRAAAPPPRDQGLFVAPDALFVGPDLDASRVASAKLGRYGAFIGVSVAAKENRPLPGKLPQRRAADAPKSAPKFAGGLGGAGIELEKYHRAQFTPLPSRRHPQRVPGRKNVRARAGKQRL
jgi:hypothetical protein